jgi:hypothetical protein
MGVMFFARCWISSRLRIAKGNKWIAVSVGSPTTSGGEGIAMPYRQQFRNYAEHCLRLAELIDAPQRASLIDTANAWRRFAQELDLRDELTGRGSPHHRNTQGTSGPNSPYGIRS